MKTQMQITEEEWQVLLAANMIDLQKQDGSTEYADFFLSALSNKYGFEGRTVEACKEIYIGRNGQGSNYYIHALEF
jgi:hypothetical protein